MTQKFLGFAVAYKLGQENKIYTPTSVSPELAKANCLKNVVGMEVTSSWTKTKVNENFDFYCQMQQTKVVKVYTEEIEDQNVGT